jgi:protein-L-isoaspartate(D-aspartate) O-methyltransferase
MNGKTHLLSNGYRSILLSLALLLAACEGAESPTDQALVASSPPPQASASEAVQPSATTSPANPTSTIEGDPYLEKRLKMVREDIASMGIENEDVLRAMSSVPRHKFVPEEYLDQAYENHPLPIGYGQTISQPYVVAWMTELLELKPGEKVLEIGTGSGYQAAVLAELGYVEVYSIEIVPELAESVGKRLEEAGYTDIHLTQGDGYYGWPEEISFDAIIVTAAPDHLPAPLAAQLVEGGRMVIPIGPPGGFQTLWKFVKQDGELVAYNMGGVAFVPLTGAGVQGSPAVTPP